MIGKGIQSANQQRHSFVQDHFEVGLFTDPTVFAHRLQRLRSRVQRMESSLGRRVQPGREILTTTPAIPAHRPGGSAREIEIDGGVITHGEGIVSIELDGAIQSPWVSGEFEAA